MEKVAQKKFVKNVNAPLTQEQYDRVYAFAKDKGVNVSDVLRTALAMFLEIHGDK